MKHVVCHGFQDKIIGVRPPSSRSVLALVETEVMPLAPFWQLLGFEVLAFASRKTKLQLSLSLGSINIELI